MNGHFIELTDVNGKRCIVGLRFIRRITNAPDGAAVVHFDNGDILHCQSYEDVRLTLLHTQPPDATINQR